MEWLLTTIEKLSETDSTSIRRWYTNA
uniref:Uncharacterized protein n=1 Tax=Anguilla anguilla TaxID=7936 RepID=A0A0E9S9G4_ANGAN